MVTEFLKMPKFKPLDLLGHNRGVLGVNMNHLARRPEILGAEMEGLVELYRKGVVRPHVDKVFPLAEAGAAHRFIQERKNVGKVLLSV
jgi:NADPH:quinone reductase-like Zn-dependent oxidoreductase